MSRASLAPHATSDATRLVDQSLVELDDFGNKESARAGDPDAVRPDVVVGKRLDGKQVVVDEGGLEPTRDPGDALAVWREMRGTGRLSTPAALMGYDHEVDADRSAPAPRPRLSVGHEPARDQGGVQLGLVRDPVDAQCQIRIRGHRRDSQVAVADPQVDRLSTDQHDRCPLLTDRLQRIEQDPPRRDVLQGVPDRQCHDASSSAR